MPVRIILMKYTRPEEDIWQIYRRCTIELLKKHGKVVGIRIRLGPTASIVRVCREMRYRIAKFIRALCGRSDHTAKEQHPEYGRGQAVNNPPQKQRAYEKTGT